MTDRELAERTVIVNGIENAARVGMASADSGYEREHAAQVLRHAVALRRSLEQWIVGRATRAPIAADSRRGD